MFIEDDDWNDEADAQALSETILHKTLKSDCRARVKPKAVGRKSLLRTLQTLGPARQQPASEDARQDSDSDAEAASSPHKKKRKKKRSKRRKHAGVSGQETEEPEGGRGEQKRGDVPKKQKKKGLTSGSPKGKKMDPGGEEAKVESVELEVKKDENANQRSRKQWKNKMKNQRKCKNKYKQNTPKTELKTADPATSTEVIEQSKVNVCSEKGKKTSSQAPTQNKGKIKDREPLKRKRVEAAEHVSDTPDKITTKLNTQPMEKEFRERNQITMDVLESSGQKPKCKLAQSVGETREENRTATSRRPKVEMSKEERRRREKLRKLRKLLHGEGSDTPPDPAEARTEHGAPSPPPPPGEGPEEAPASRSAALRSRMEQRLESARFRYINEVLYTTSSGEAKRMFKQDPGAFGIYHKGFTAQVQRWPENPVDNIIAFIQKRPASQVVADFGCGDCKIARSVKNKVHSFDLAAVCELVTVCDMANVPLGDGSVNIAVFCLSLMGTNLIDFLVEANRVLMMGGVLKVAEVASRFDNVRGFLTAVANLGFKMVKKDTENSHFYSFEFVKTKDAAENVKKSSLQLRPCVYKKR